jgi:hypothetical protein
MGTKSWHTYYNPRLLWPADLPNRVYYLVDDGTTVFDQKEDRTKAIRTMLALATVDLEREGEDAFVSNLDLIEHFPEFDSPNMQLPRLHYKNRKIYVAAMDRVLIVGLSDPDEPELLEVLKTEHWSSGVVRYSGGTLQDEAHIGEPKYGIRLPPLPGLSPRERLEAWVDLGSSFGSTVLDGSLLLTVDRDALEVYEVIDLKENLALLVQLGTRTMTPLERFWQSSAWQANLVDGIAYVAQGGGLSVFDLHDPTNPKRTGHYRAPTEHFRCLSVLEDGRVLAGGNNLHLLAPPRRATGH